MDNDTNQTDNTAANDMKVEQITALVNADFFELVGLTDLTDEEKDGRLREMEQNIFVDFMQNDLPALIDERQQEELDEFLKRDDAKPEDVMAKISEFVPDVEDIIFAKSIEMKRAVILEYLGTRALIMKEQKRLLENRQSPNPNQSLQEKVNNLERVEHDRALLEQALDLYKDGKWSEGVEILKGLILKK